MFHLAAAVGVKLVADDPVRTIETNIYPTELLLRLAVQGKQRVFLASTSEVYGKNPKDRWTEEDDLYLGPTSRPRWAYGCSKAIDEFLALAYHRKHSLSRGGRAVFQRGRTAAGRPLWHGDSPVRRPGARRRSGRGLRRRRTGAVLCPRAGSDRLRGSADGDAGGRRTRVQYRQR